jgi:hypothetical protein
MTLPDERYRAIRQTRQFLVDLQDRTVYPRVPREDWSRFGDWLDTFETDFMWTLDQLVEMYERSNPKIRWANDRESKEEV